MTVVLGQTDGRGIAASIGHYRARDGSQAAGLSLDLDRPHVVVIVGKRGYGKSHTLGVIAEAVATVDGIAPVVIDPMGEFSGLGSGPAVGQPSIMPGDLEPGLWCELLGLEATSGPGGVLWDSVASGESMQAISAAIDEHDGAQAHRLVAQNHLDRAVSWGIFDRGGLDVTALAGPEVSVLDLSGLPDGAKNAIVSVVASQCYRARVTDSINRLPWLLVDEVHTFFDGVAAPALRQILTRGRTPGVSLVAATQRPSAIPQLGLSQADIVIAHRLTGQAR
ncbi:MAG: ATPase [Natrialbaceae archaeon]|nr:ATPase [Natrialbaceae archaeon]